MKTRIISIAFAMLVAAEAQADFCPPSVEAFDTWTWIPSWNSGDDWVTDLVCSSGAQRDAVRNLVITHLGLDENWDYWDDMLGAAEVCDPNDWGGRVINGGYATQLVGEHRDNDSFAHFASPGGILPDGTPVQFWLSQYSNYYVSEEGYKWQCLADGDNGGPGDGFTYASNPSTNSACSFYYPWFWNKTVLDRASTIVHEATHEFEGHIANSACTNGASCDTSFMAANAQTFQVIFQAQAIDAYQRQPGSRELEVVNFGNEVCGYLPLLPDLDRFALLNEMVNKLQSCFQTVPPASSYPASAFLDTVPGTIYDLAGNPGGQANVAYRIDIVNSARWSCAAICNVADYTWSANGPDGVRSCNEDYQPENAGINAFNRNRCNELNAQLAAGVTPAQHTSLRSQVYSTMKPCKTGVSEDYLDEVCQDLLPGADHVDDIDNTWPLPDNIGYGYSAEESIRACQVKFCSAQNIDAWEAAASEMCYEWDDEAGCMDLLCGDLAELDPEPGRASQDYLEAVICRASELGRQVPGLRKADVGCQAVFNDCIVQERYMPLWEAQLAGDDCWSDSLPNGGVVDPYFVDLRAQVGRLSYERFVALDRGPGLMVSECAIKETECEALQAAMRAIMARIARMKYRQREPWRHPPGPDPWERFDDHFDRDFELGMVELADSIDQNIQGGPLYQNAALRRATAMPEAQVAMAELVGLDTYFGAGALRFGTIGAGAAKFNANQIFSPERLRRFAGAEPERDPYTGDLGEFEGDLAALRTLNQRLSTRQWNALIGHAGELPGATYYGHMEALLGARTGADLLAAHDALMADLEALQR